MSASSKPNPPKCDPLYEKIVDRLCVSGLSDARLRETCELLRQFWVETWEQGYEQGTRQKTESDES